MKVLFLSMGKIDSIYENGIYTDLLREFKKNGHEIYIMTPVEKKYSSETEYFLKEGVHLLKVRIGNLSNVNIFEKGLTTINIERIFLKSIKKYFSNVRFDLVLYATPPVTFAKVISYIRKRDNAKTYLLLKDIFPQNAVDLEIIKEKSIVNSFFKYKEKQLYKVSDYIGCMSPANVEYLLSNNSYLKDKNIEVCPNSIEPQKIISVNKKEILNQYNIPADKIIFIYGGNLGKPQGIDFLIACLQKNKENRNVHFVIAGDGTEYSKLKSYIEKNELLNVSLLKNLPKDKYNDLVNVSDIGMIFLDNRFKIPNFPSRLLSYMQASKPIIAATDINTDIGKIMEKYGFGYWCESKNPQDFTELVNKFIEMENRTIMGKNSREYLENNYTAKHSYQIIIKHFN